MGSRPADHQGEGAPIFVMGCIRSGTTLLAELLNAHPDFAIFCESFLIRSSFVLKDVWSELELARENRASDFVSFLLEEYNPYGNGQRPILAFLDTPALRNELIRSDPSLHAWILVLFRAWGRHQGARRWGDKATPQQVGEILEMYRLFPEGNFVHIHRDPRGVARSLVKAGWSTDLAAAAATWRVAMSAIRSGLAAIPADQVYEISYRSLCTNPELVLRGVCDFLGERFLPALMDCPRPTNPTLANVSVAAIAANAASPIIERNFDAWRTVLDRTQVNLVESIAGDLMHEYGYEPDGESVGQRGTERIRTLRLLRDRRKRLEKRNRILFDHLTTTVPPV